MKQPTPDRRGAADGLQAGEPVDAARIHGRHHGGGRHARHAAVDRGPGVIRQLVALCDGILVTGGQDVAPEMYGETASPEYLAMNPELSPELDRMEALLIPEVIATDTPMLGICRGVQVLNAVLGGTMWHDLPTEQPSDVEHHMPNPPYDLLGHEVDLVPGTPLAELMEASGEGRRIAVNSYHHRRCARLPTNWP